MEQTALQGHKGGGKKQHTPVETKNNLLSKSIAKVLLAIGEGEFAGIPKPEDIFLDGTPLVSAGGLENFGGVTWDFRSGRSDQTYITGMPDVSNEFAVGFELTDEASWTRFISNTLLDAVRITLAWPALYMQQENGDITGYNIAYAIDVSTDGGAYVEQGKWDTNNGKTNVEYDRTHRITLPRPGSSWTIRVRRITPNKRTAKYADTMSVKSFAEVIDAKLRYPNTALLYVEFDAETFGGSSIPKVSIKTKGRLIQVPSNYDPTSRAYSGVWNGVFKWAWTDNPAWIFYDLVTNERFGLGARIKPEMVDKWTLYQVAQYCDVLVPDGKGGQEPRYTCNIYIQSRKEAWQVLRDIVAVFNGMLHWSGTQIVATADMPVAINTVRNYNRSNVIDGKFTYGSTSEKTIATTALVSFDDPDNHYETAVEAVNDLTLVQRYKTWNQAEIAAMGTTSRGQAQRKGKYQMLTNSLNRVVTFRLGMEGYLPRPGEVFGVADQVLAGSGFSGRISAATARTVTCDREPNAAAGDILYVNKADGTSAEGRTIQSVDGRVITVTANYSATPEVELGWYVEKTTLKSQLFRTTKVTWNDNEGKFEVTGVQYEDSKYATVDTGARLESRPITSIPAGGQEPPTGLTLSSYSFVEQTMAVTTLAVSWSRVAGAMNYEAQWRKDGGDWINVGRTASTGFEVKGIYKGAYQARVRALNVYGSASVWVQSDNTDMNGKDGAPPVVPSLTTETLLFGIALKWAFPEGAEDTARTEVWYNATSDRSTATKLADLAYPQSDYTMQGLRAGQQFFFWVRLVDKSGNIGEYFPNSQYGIVGQASSDAGAILEQIADSITKSQLGQELLGDINRITDNSPGSVNDRLNNAKTDLSNQISNVAGEINTVKAGLEADLATAKHDLQQQIDAIDVSETLPYDSTKSYTVGQVALGADGRLYQAKQTVPVNTSPPDNTYWTDVGAAIVTADGIAARVLKTEQDVSTIDGKLTSESSRIDGVQSTLNNKADASAVSSLTSRVTSAEGNITSQGQAITGLTNNLANKADASAMYDLQNRMDETEGGLQNTSMALTTLTNTVNSNPGSGTNLLVDTYSWLTSTMPPVNVSGITASTSGSAGLSGYAYRMVVPASAPTTVSLQLAASSIGASRNTYLEAGSYLVSFWVYSTQNDGQLRVGIVGATTSYATTVGLTTTRRRLVSTLTVPTAGLFSVTIFPKVLSSVAAAHEVHIDSIMIERQTGSTIPSTFVPGSSAATVLATSSAVQSLTSRVTTAEGAINSQGQALTNLTNTVDGKADSSALTALTSRITDAENSITSQGSSITTLNNTVSGINGSVNLLPSMYTMFGEVAPTMYVQPGVFASTVANDKAIGKYQLKVQNTVAANVGSFSLAAGQSDWNMKLKPGQKYIVSFWVQADAARTMSVCLRYLNTVGAVTEVELATVQATTTLTRVSAVLAAPLILVDSACLVIYQSKTASLSTHYYDGFMLEEQIGTGTAPSTYVGGDSSRQANAASTAISGLTNRVASTELGLDAMSSQVTVLDVNLGDSSGENLCYNPAFTKYANLTGSPDGWLTEGPLTSTDTIVTSWINIGEKAQRIEVSGLDSASNYKGLRVSSAAPDYRVKVTEDKFYTASVFLRGTVGLGFRMYLQWIDSAGAAITTPATPMVSVTGNGRRETFTAQAPTGAVRCTMFLRIYSMTGAITSGFAEFTRPQFETGIRATGWRNNGQVNSSDIAATSTAVSSLTSTVNQQGNTLTSQGQSITSLTNTISGISATGTNLLEDTYSWLASTTLPPVYQASVTATGVAVPEASSGFGYSISAVGASGIYASLYLASAPTVAATNLKLEPGTYLVSMWVKGATAGTCLANFYDMTTSRGVALNYTTTRTRYTFVIPVNASISAALLIYPNYHGGATANIVVDSVMVEKQVGNGTTPSPFVPGVSSRQLFAQGTALSTLTNRVTNAEGVLASQSGTITDLQNSIGTAGSFDAAPNCTWNFDSTIEGWTATGATLTLGSGFITVTATGNDPVLISPAAYTAFSGALYTRVRAKVTRRAGAATDWDGALFYSTSGHGFAAGYYNRAANPNLAVGESKVVEWDMSTLTAGGTDWLTSTIQQIRLDFGATNGGVFEVDWISIGRLAPSASSRAVSSLESKVTQQGNDITATASALSGLTATVGSNTASIQQLSTTTVNTNNSINASWSVKLMTTSNGTQVAAGFGLGLGQVGGVTQSQFVVSADRFSVLNSSLNGTVTSPFSVVGGVTYLADTFIRNASITNAKIGGVIQSDAVDGYGRPLWSLNKGGALELNSTNSQYRRDMRANYDRFWYLPTGVLVIEIGELS